MKRIKELRTAKKLTQAELAKQLQVTQQTVAQWEKGKSTPNDAKLAELAALLDTTVEYLTEADSKIDLNVLKQKQELLSEKNKTVSNTTDPILADWQARACTNNYYLGIQPYENSNLIWYPIKKADAYELIECLYEDDFEQKFMVVKTANYRTLFINKEKIHHIEIETVSRPTSYMPPWDGYDGFSTKETYEEIENLHQELFNAGYDILHFIFNDTKPSLTDDEKEKVFIELKKHTQNPEILNAFEYFCSNKDAWFEASNFMIKSNVWLKNSEQSLRFDQDDNYNLAVLNIQLRRATNHQWIDLGEPDVEKYTFYRSSDCCLIELNTIQLEKAMANYYKKD